MGSIIYIMPTHQRISKIINYNYLYRKNYLPDIIFEDPDEIRLETANFYKDFNILRYKSKSQDSTELEKTLTYILDNNQFKTSTKNL